MVGSDVRVGAIRNSDFAQVAKNVAALDGDPTLVSPTDVTKAHDLVTARAEGWDDSVLPNLARLGRMTGAVIPGLTDVPKPDTAGDLTLRLDDTQREVLAYVDALAAKNAAIARPLLIQRLANMEGRQYTEAQLDQAMDWIRTKSIMSVNFYPDKDLPPPGAAPAAFAGARDWGRGAMPDDGNREIDGLLADPTYKNQFQTMISGGCLAPAAGSPRDRWEATIFGGIYQKHPLIPSERPKYGALDVTGNIHGAAAVYGNSYLELEDAVRPRVTFTPHDSSICNANQVGNFNHFEHVLNALDDGTLHVIMSNALDLPVPEGVVPGPGYWEYQLHGDLDEWIDTKAVVADQVYEPTPYADDLRHFALENENPLDWITDTGIVPDAPPPAAAAPAAPAAAVPPPAAAAPAAPA
jgi:hypothetical protein